MARTFVPDPGPLRIFLRKKTILNEAFEALKYVQADYDKAGDMEDWAYYEGARDAYAHIVRLMTKQEGESSCKLLLSSCQASVSSLLRRLL